MNRSDRYDRRANGWALLGMLLLAGACFPVWSVVFALVFQHSGEGWLMKFTASGCLFAVSMLSHSRSRHWSDEANAERPFTTKENLSSPRWHGAPSNENDN